MEVYPYAWMFFVPFILITSFAVVNVLVGLIVNSMHDAHSEEATEATDAYRDDVISSISFALIAAFSYIFFGVS